MRQAELKLSAWLAVVLDGVEEADDLLWKRLAFLLRALETPENEAREFLDDFRGWLDRMEYHWLEDFRSELQYRLALALDMEDEEDERSRLFLKISEGLSRTREQFSRRLDSLFSSHGELNESFWEELEELFIMADLGYEPSLELVERLRERARKENVTRVEDVRGLLMAEVDEIFRLPRRISAVNPPEVVLFIGVNGVGKTTTIAKLAYRAKMQGKKVLIAAADTFRAAAVEQLEVWARRIGADFHAKGMGADPAAGAFEAMDKAMQGGYDVLFIDTAGIKRRQLKLTGAEYYSSLRTQAAIERCELALILFDASQPVSDQDLKVMSTAVDAGRAIVLVFNKWDAMDEFDKQRLERLWNTEFDRVMWAERVNLSAKTGWHTNRLTRAMDKALESWDQRIPTGKLNAFLGKIQAAHPHPLRGGKQPRILFATQASTRPPRFVIFATGFLEHGYRRYIERSLREEFGFEGTPIQISVNIREKKKRK